MASHLSPSFEESFDALIKFLQKAIKAQETISIPDEIEKPFRAVSQPSDASLLRKLLKLFDGKQQHHVLQLAPKSFCGLVSIALHFPYSTTQDKLLHTFMNALRVYRDDSAAILSLQKCGLHNVKKTQVQTDRQAISQRLLHTLLKRYVGGGLEKKLRWTIAQFLSTLVYDDDFARRRLASYPEIQHLSTLLQDLDDYVGRFLVSNLIRELVYHGIDPAIFWAQGTPNQLILDFPIAEHSSVGWLADLHQFFAGFDATLAFGAGRQCVLPVPEFTCTRGADDRAGSHAIVVVSEDLTFLTAGNEDMLRIKSFPMFQDLEMTVSSTSTENTIRVTYLKDNGFELCNGSKSAVNSISLTLESTNDAQLAQEMILKGQKDTGSLVGTKGTEKTDTAAETPEPKRSIALLNLWSPESQLLSTAQPTPHAGQTRDDSDTRNASPLQHRSQPLSQTNTTRVHGNQGRSGLDSETASETSFLEAAQDKQALPERLQASQSSSSNVQNASDFNARVDDAVARHKSSKLDPKAVAPESRPNKEGTTTKRPNFPRETAEQPLKSNLFKQNLLLGSDKNLSDKHVQKPTVLLGAVAVLPVAPVVLTAASLNSKKGSMAKLSSGPPQATSTLKKPTKTLGGPAARLAGSQQQGQNQASKSTSSTDDAIKRKSLTSQKEVPSKTTDWDQDLRDDSQFDIPADPSEDERPTKRARKGGKQPARKPAVRSSKAAASKKTQASKNTTKAPGGLKKAKTEQHAKTLKETVASTRERRPQKPAKYVEDSGSEIAEPEGEEQNSAELGNASEVASSTIKDAASQSVQAPTASKKVGGQRRVHSQSINKPTANTRNAEQQQILPLPKRLERDADHPAHQDTSVSHMSPEDILPKSAAKTSAPTPDVQPREEKAVVEVARPSQPDQPELVDDMVAEDAQDSYPMNRAGRDAAAAAAGDSFGTHLQTQLADIRMDDHADEQGKENVPPAPETPFGNKKTFIANVNAAKSNSAKKALVSQIPISPESHAPRSARESATGVREAVATGKPSDHPAPAPAAISGNVTTSKEASQTTEGGDEAPPAEPLQDDPVVVAGGEPHENLVALPAQHVRREDRMASVRAAETSSDASRLGGAVLEPFNEVGHSAEVQSQDNSHNETADRASTANVPRLPEASSGGAVVNDILQVSLKKRKSLAEIANSKKGQKTRASDIGQGLKVMVDASRTGQSSTVNDPAHSGARNAPKAQADETIVAREPKQALRTSTTLEARKMQTPRRQNEVPARMLTSEKINKKPSIVGFAARGPRNQGVPARRESYQSSEVSLPSPVTEKHHEAEQQEKDDLSTDTPSHQLAPLTESSKLIADAEEERDAGEEGIVVEEDVEVGNPRSAGDSDHGKRAREEPRYNESTASIGQASVNQPENVAVSPETDVAAAVSPDETYHDASVQDLSPSSGSEAEEASEYEEALGSVDDSAEVEESRDEEPRIEEPVAGPSAPRLHDTPKARVNSSDEVVRKLRADARDSIGLGPLLKKSNPSAGEKITTSLFRATHEQSNRVRNVDRSTISEPEIRKQATKAIKDQSADDVSLMPPPRTRLRQGAEIDIGCDTTKPSPARGSFLDSRASADRTANPLAQLSTTSTLDAVKLPESRNGDTTKEPVVTAPIRVKRRIEVVSSPKPSLPVGTPIPFHAMLAETSTHGEEAGNRRKTGSYVSKDTADATLVNGNPLSTLFEYPARRKSRYEREMTETTDDSPPPPSSAGDSRMERTDKMAWEQAVRSPHRSLAENVMQIANGVLFRLGSEEDAIRAKVCEYQRGCNAVLAEARRNWDSRILHENSKVVQSLAVGRDALAAKLEELGKDGKGATQEWKKISRVSEVAKMVEAREQDVLAGLEALSGGVDA